MLRNLGYILFTGLIFCLYHFVVSPVAAYVDSTSLGIGRGPLFEEAFKFGFAFFTLREFSIKMQSIIIGLAIGISETAINSLIVFDEMYADVSSNIDGLGENEVWIAISLGLAAKAAFAIFAHGAMFFAGLKLANGDYLKGFFIAAALHFFANLLLNGI